MEQSSQGAARNDTYRQRVGYGGEASPRCVRVLHKTKSDGTEIKSNPTDFITNRTRLTHFHVIRPIMLLVNELCSRASFSTNPRSPDSPHSIWVTAL